MTPTINIVIPMAGDGQRFHEFGYRAPKPLIEIHGKPIIQLVTKNLSFRHAIGPGDRLTVTGRHSLVGFVTTGIPRD